MELLHPIQREIMRRLTLLMDGRYSDLKPDDIDGNLFLYHLNQLIADGYVSKDEKRYGLTVKGKRHASVISVDTGLPRLQPKIVVMLDVQNENGERLLFRWKRQPFYGSVSLPYGKTWFGSSLLEMAERELAIKSGLTGSFEHVGDAYVKTVVEGELLSHMLAHVFRVQETCGKLGSTVSTGECFWGRWQDLPESQWAPGLPELSDLMDAKNDLSSRFFEEITVS